MLYCNISQVNAGFHLVLPPGVDSGCPILVLESSVLLGEYWPSKETLDYSSRPTEGLLHGGGVWVGGLIHDGVWAIVSTGVE